MAINYDQIMQLESRAFEASYGDREAMLYALGVGFGRDPLNTKELKFVYENDLQIVPSFATVIGWHQPTLSGSGLNYLMIVHAEQRLTLHKPLPPEAEVLCDARVSGAFDKGVSKGALVLVEKKIREKKSGELLCTLVATVYARGDGGFGGPREGAP